MKQVESFFFGIIAALGAIVFQLIFFILFSAFIDPAGNLNFSQFFSIPFFIFITAFIEELFKCLVIFKKIKSASLKYLLIDVLFITAGFFSIELFLITKSGPLQLKTIFEIGLLHLGTSVLMATIMSTKYTKWLLIASSLTLATAFHFLYNYSLSKSNLFLPYSAPLLIGSLFIISFFVSLRIQSRLARV